MIHKIIYIMITLMASLFADTVSQKTATTNSYLDQLSFFAWNGVSRYDSAVNSLTFYPKPEIYLNPIEKGNNTHFITNVEKVQRAGSKVWYLMSGDPSISYIEKQIIWISTFNNTHVKKILGMSFDMEPWTKFSIQNSYLNRDAWQEYLGKISYARDLLHTHHLKLSVAIPFWLNTVTEAFPNGRNINYEVVDIADETIVMDYTIFIDRFYKFARNTLEYADSKKNKTVKIALEMGKATEENVSFYDRGRNIKPFLATKIPHHSFRGYILHTLDDFTQSNIQLIAPEKSHLLMIPIITGLLDE